MPLADLLTALERDGQQAIDQELERGRTEARRILEEAAANATRQTGEELARHDAELRAQAERDVVAAKRRAEGLVLEARGALLDRVFRAAEAAFPAARAWPEYRAALDADIEQGIRFLPEGKVVVTCAAPDQTLVETLLGNRENPAVAASGELTAGIRVTSGDGVIEVDRRLTTRLRAGRPALSIELLAALEPPP
jgi:vacuolar-type H+-ATPase subunit E/Vma4